MARQKRKSERRATSDAPDREEQAAQDIHDLPDRDAMSILTGLPMIPALPPDLLGDQTLPPATGAPAPTETVPTDAAGPLPPETTAQPGDVNTVAPSNQVSQTNVDSEGTTQTTGATQHVPIVQSSS